MNFRPKVKIFCSKGENKMINETILSDEELLKITGGDTFASAVITSTKITIMPLYGIKPLYGIMPHPLYGIIPQPLYGIKIQP